MINDVTHLAALRQAMTGHVENGDAPGIVTLVARGNDVHVDAIGVQVIGDRAPMRRDTIFRIASMTKPITAAATMMLIDDGRLGLDESIEHWLPELAARRVLKRIDSALDDTVPATRAITVRDLLTSTFGFGSVMAMPGTYPFNSPFAMVICTAMACRTSVSCPSRTNTCADWAHCRSCTNRASAGRTTRVAMCSVS